MLIQNVLRVDEEQFDQIFNLNRAGKTEEGVSRNKIRRDNERLSGCENRTRRMEDLAFKILL